MSEHFDVLIVGAGLSGIGAGSHLRRLCPDRSFAILEGRPRIGGTWDLFRYPGIRSDSDMYTLGYSFKPWTQPKAIADGPSIREYVEEAAHENGLVEHIRFEHKVVNASWSSAEARWSVEAQRGPEGTPVGFTCNFLFMCAGYYDTEAGYDPEIPGRGDFAGRIVHPQKWTDDIEYAGKRVVVIGSGATAVTIVPEMAKDAAHVTMLQRSPTYMISRPASDAVADWLRARLPAKLAYAITRWKNVLLGAFFFQLARRRPKQVKARLIEEVRAEVGPATDVETHFTPHYDPWDQRLCLVPDADFFHAVRDGHADVVTDHIECITEKGIRLQSGAELAADLIVMATGLELKLLGGLELTVDGRSVDPAESLTYKGMMFSDIPNLANSMGYTNASWTLKCDLTCEYVCRLLNHMKAKGYDQCTPRNRDPEITPEPWADFSSGYIQRSLDKFPNQGSKQPWRMHQNYALDVAAFRLGRLEDGVMEFESARAPVAAEPASTDLAGDRARA